MDGPEALADGSVPGVKAAAVRKLQHELGISSDEVPASSFTFLTRLHYCAPDEASPGPDDPPSASAAPPPAAAAAGAAAGGPGGTGRALWGEHEMDYVLVARPAVTPLLAPNPEEVCVWGVLS